MDFIQINRVKSKLFELTVSSGPRGGKIQFNWDLVAMWAHKWIRLGFTLLSLRMLIG